MSAQSGHRGVMTAPAVELNTYWSWQLRGLCQDHPAELFFPEEEKHGVWGAMTTRERLSITARAS